MLDVYRLYFEDERLYKAPMCKNYLNRDVPVQVAEKVPLLVFCASLMLTTGLTATPDMCKFVTNEQKLQCQSHSTYFKIQRSNYVGLTIKQR